MPRQPSCSGTAPGPHGMWIAQELDAGWSAWVAGAATGEWPEWPSEDEPPGPSGTDELPGRSGTDELPGRSGTDELPGPSGTGAEFAAGGLLNRLAPGAMLAGSAQNAWADGLDTMSDDALVGVLRAWRRLASWATAGELAAVAELDRRRRAEVAAGADPHLVGHVGDELAVSLTLTTRSADALLDFACGLARLPLTRAALVTGQIDRTKALVITDGVSCLGDAHAAAVESAVIGRAPGQTSGQLRAATQRAVLAVDPAAAERRREEARKDARVEVWNESSGTAALAGRDLPPADVLAADKRIDALARHLKSAGREETLSELRSQVYLALLLGQPVGPGQPVEGCTSEEPPGPGTTQAGSRNDQDNGAAPGSAGDGAATGPDGGAAPGPDHGAAPGPGDGAGMPPRRPAPAGPGLTGSVNLTMPVATWLGGSSEPGEAAGFGPLPAEDARALANLIARQPGARWCLTLTGRDGRAIAHGCARAGPHMAGRDGQPRGEPWSSRDGPAAREPGAARAGPPLGWALTVTVRPLAVGECLHERESKGYQPAPSLRHVVNVRQRTCGFPGCRNPAARCDQDHTIPHDQGGRTCECNLACLCRRHHQAKQAQGWWLDQPEPGVLVWRLPHGRSYRVEPRRYPG
jgi:hypothetical protein